MKNPNLHPMSALIGAGVVLLAGVLSAQQIANRFVSVRVLDVPELKTQAATWPPSPENVFFESFTVTNGNCGQNTDVYIVPAEKWLVLQSVFVNNGAAYYIRPGDQSYSLFPSMFTINSGVDRGIGVGPIGISFPSGTRIALNPSSSSCSSFCEASGYLVDD